MKIELQKDNDYLINIKNEEDAHNLLSELVSNKVVLDKFEIKKPTLNDIFIEKVGEQYERFSNCNEIYY